MRLRRCYVVKPPFVYPVAVTYAMLRSRLRYLERMSENEEKAYAEKERPQSFSSYRCEEQED